MITISDRIETRVDVGADWLFRQLCDPAQIVACVPGATLTRQLGADRFEARMTVRLGALALGYAGQGLLVASGRGTRRLTMMVRGADLLRTTSADAWLIAAVEQDGTGALVRARMRLDLSGGAARLSKRLVEAVACRLIEQTTERMRSRFARLCVP
ncbi:MAG TPA: SRPBCC domain-containing protein [Candidatus Dormibacteraeota bacterium]